MFVDGGEVDKKFFPEGDPGAVPGKAPDKPDKKDG